MPALRVQPNSRRGSIIGATDEAHREHPLVRWMLPA
jgi:hypothetical protein